MLLKGKTVIVTGAGGALGQAAVKTVEELGGRAIEFDLSFRDEDASRSRFEIDLTDRAAVEETVSRIGDFDAVLNIAGGFAMGHDAAGGDDDDWAQMFRLNVETCRNMVKAAVPVLKKTRGAMVNVGAYAALSGKPQMGAYVASKAVVMRLTETLAEELRGEGVNVNAVLPTILDTEANREAMPDADPANWVSPDHLAAVMCFLISETAKDVHGALLPVRGLS
ncbi:SDR family NAD(P)-dependent oxidoreductase [Parvularcula marina]|uniref:SDR family NAD(P)-dependent oxidoreductase n=1 Tax=Parvularcula marina TaxID=2292771 RepID=UPI003515229B